MLKNRTLIGIILIVIAIALCFGITPLFSKILEQKTTVIRLKEDIPQGAQIQTSMLEAVEVGTLNLPQDMIYDPAEIIGKYTVSAMFVGDTFSPSKLSDTIDTSDTLLRQLDVNETAMSVTVRSFANGLSGKLQTGDIIQIISVDEENDDEAIIYDELQYVEVLATTADNGSDDTYNADEVNYTEDDDDEQSLYATITVICQDRAQALKLAECENTTLHAVFVCRGDSERKEDYLQAQRDVLGVVKEDYSETDETSAESEQAENETDEAAEIPENIIDRG
jgi:pilus assembly protein CpaB